MSAGTATKASAPVAWDSTVTGVACARLREAEWRVRGAALALRSAPDLRLSAAPGVSVAALRSCAAELELRLDAAEALVVDLERLHDDTMLAGRAYELASDAVLRAVEELAGGAAYAAGVGARALVGAAFGAALGTVGLWGPALAAGVGGALLVGLVAVPLAARLAALHPAQAAAVTALAERAGRAVDPFLAQASAFWDRAGESLLANPAFVTALALAVESSDEALAGFLGVPVGTARAIESTVGQDELLAGLVGGAVIATRVGGGVRPVRVAALTPSTPPRAPVSTPAAAMRVIRDQPGQVSIHEHRMPDGSRRFQVFVDGTQDVGLDDLANVENAASTPRALLGSDRAVVEAMEAAGIGPDDPVDVFGYSQGAGAVANVAASGRFRVETALLVAGPVATAELPPGVAVLSVAHEGDLVAASDGIADGAGPTTVLLESAGGHGAGALARHSRAEYLTTLKTTDDFVVAHWQQHLGEATAGGRGVAAHDVALERG